MKKIVTTIILFILAISYNYAQNSILIEFTPKKYFFDQPDFHLYKNDDLIYSRCHSKNNNEILFNITNGNYKLKFNGLNIVS